MIAIVTIVKETPCPTKHKTSQVYTKIIEDHDELLQSLLQKGLIQLPPMNKKATKTIKFCGYHRVHGHKTYECKKFKDII